MKTKTADLKIRLKPEERELLESAAKDEGLTLSAFIRSKALKAAKENQVRC